MSHLNTVVKYTSIVYTFSDGLNSILPFDLIKRISIKMHSFNTHVAPSSIKLNNKAHIGNPIPLYLDKDFVAHLQSFLIAEFRVA